MVTQSQILRHRGFTLLEIVVSMVLVVLLATVLLASMKHLRNRAERVKCLTHMKTIHGGLNEYITEVGHWPQLEMPEGGNLSEEDYFRQMIDAVEVYGVAPEVWICPSDKDGLAIIEGKVDGLEITGSYAISKFDNRASSPFKYNQPWLMERGSFHRGGGHILMPDGSIQQRFDRFFGR